MTARYFVDVTSSKHMAMEMVFNVNRFSLVGYFADAHHDIFHCKTRLMQNKSLFVDTTWNGYNSQGGAMSGNYFCFVILDWSYVA